MKSIGPDNSQILFFLQSPQKNKKTTKTNKKQKKNPKKLLDFMLTSACHQIYIVSQEN